MAVRFVEASLRVYITNNDSVPITGFYRNTARINTTRAINFSISVPHTLSANLKLSPTPRIMSAKMVDGGYDIEWLYTGEITRTTAQLIVNAFDINYTTWREDTISPSSQKAPITVQMSFSSGSKTFGGMYIDEVSLTQQQIANAENITTGVISSYGSITLNDVDYSIYQLVMDGTISATGQSLIIRYYGGEVGSFIVEKSDYDYNARKLSLSLTDTLAKWDDIAFTAEINNFTDLYTPLVEILKFAGYSTQNIDNALTTPIRVYDKTDRAYTVKEYLQAIKYDSPQTFKGAENNCSVRQAVDYICQVAQLCCYLNNGGSLRFASVRPFEMLTPSVSALPHTATTAWSITPRYTYTDLSANLLLTNKVSSAAITVSTADGYETKTYPADTVVSAAKQYVQSEQNPFLTDDCKLVLSDEDIHPPISTVISENVVADYDSGVRAGDVDVAVLDYYDVLNSKPATLKAENGQLLNLGDVVTFIKDSFGTADDVYRKDRTVYWKVRGRQFSYSGVGKLQLQLQELAYSMPEFLADTAPVVRTQLYDDIYFESYTTVTWTAVDNPKLGATVQYDLYVNNELYQTYSSPQEVKIETPKGTPLNIFVRAHDTTGTYVAMESNVVTVTIPVLTVVELDCTPNGYLGVTIEYPQIPGATNIQLLGGTRVAYGNEFPVLLSTYTLDLEDLLFLIPEYQYGMPYQRGDVISYSHNYYVCLSDYPSTSPPNESEWSNVLPERAVQRSIYCFKVRATNATGKTIESAILYVSLT